MVEIHPNATTTPRTRGLIQQAEGSVASIARRFGVSEQTVRRWRARPSTSDGSSVPHDLRTTLSRGEEAVVCELRRTLLLPLDDLLRLTREFVNARASRSALDRLLRREGISRLGDLVPKEEKPAHKAFKAYEPGFVHIDVKYLPQMPGDCARKYLFVAIDRATRWVHFEIHPHKSAECATAFLRTVRERMPFAIKKILTDNGREFTDRFTNAGEREPTGEHPFDRECASNRIEHRLIKPFTPKTNGMVERFNGRIADIIRTERFASSREMAETFERYLNVYHFHLAQRVLKHQTPCETMIQWHQSHPHLFSKDPTTLPGPDRQALPPTCTF